MACLPTLTRVVLVVDDDRRLADIVAQVLKSEGYAVDTAPDGMEALARLAQRQYDVIVTDLRMPKLDGAGLYRELGRRHPALRNRVIFITGDGSNPDTRRFLAEVGAPALHKPFDMDELRRAVGEALDR
ncbi:MAG: response regulator [Candidatus Rokuibacteriota bacterium]